MILKKLAKRIKAAVVKKPPKDVILKTFYEVDFEKMEKPAVVVYKNLAEYPGKIVGKLFDGERYCNVAVLANSAFELGLEMYSTGLVFTERNKTDGPIIIGTWYKEECLCS